MKLCVYVLGLCGAVTIALGSTPQRLRPDFPATAGALELLHSSQLSEQAWGAYFAGRLRLTDHRDILVDKLRQGPQFMNGPSDGPEWWLIQSVLDALIEMHSSVPEDVLLAIERGWRAEVLILLSQSRASENALVVMRQKDLNSIEWRTVNNLMAGMRSKRLFRLLRAELSVGYRIRIEDGTNAEEAVSIMGDPIPKWNTRMRPPGFPPVPVYHLHERSTPGSVVLADGPHPVFYTRIGLADGPIRMLPPSEARGGTQADRLEYLARLSGHALNEVQNLFEPQVTIRWSTAAAISRKVRLLLDTQARDIRSFVAGAVLRNEVDSSGLHFTITPSIIDARKRSRSPLPSLRPIAISLN